MLHTSCLYIKIYKNIKNIKNEESRDAWSNHQKISFVDSLAIPTSPNIVNVFVSRSCSFTFCQVLNLMVTYMSSAHIQRH